MLFPRIVSKNYKLEAMYNFGLRHSVPGLVKHMTNFPKFAVSPENLITSQTAFVAPCWFPYSAFLEVTSAGPSSGLSPSTCGPPAGARAITVPLISRQRSGTEAGRLAYPTPMQCASARKPPAGSQGPETHTPRRPPPRGPQGPPPNPYRGDTHGAPPSPGRRTSERA